MEFSINKNSNITILGAGSWGTALAQLLSDKKFNIILWGRDKENLKNIEKLRENRKYLPSIKLNNNIYTETNLISAIDSSEIIVNAIPTQNIRTVYFNLSDIFSEKILVNTSKGIELETFKLIDQIFEDLGFDSKKIAYLSGPTFALEVAQKLPAACTLASKDKNLAFFLQKVFSTPYFRIYSETDVKGVLLGGALKNIIAIGAGIIDRMGLGNNARASLITRGIVEMQRLGIKLGAEYKTFYGLSGMGDLILTCTGDLSRNRKVGMALAEGKKLDDILKNIGMVAEGVFTAKAVYNLSKKLEIDMPIVNEIYHIIYLNKPVERAIRDLFSRELKEEKLH